MVRTMNAIRTFGVATVVTAHVRKEMAERKGGPSTLRIWREYQEQTAQFFHDLG